MNKKLAHHSILKDTTIYLIFAVTLFAVMGVASIAPAFPQIIEYFEITVKEVGWLITVFTLPGILITPFTGVLADRIGRKKILVPSLLLFGIAGFLCVFVREFELLLLLRFFQGLGAASLGSLNITLIGDLYASGQRAAVMGYNASVLSIGTAAYPALGGALAMAGWYYPFILPVLAVPFGLIIVFVLKNPEPKIDQSFHDYLKNTWKNINQRSVWGLFMISILIFVMLYGVYLIYFPILLKERMSATALYIGTAMSAMSVTTAITSSQVGKLSKKYTPRSLLLAGIIFYAFSMILLSIANQWATAVFPVILFGIGHGMTIPVFQTMLVGFAPMKERAAFMSINSMVLRIGQTIGPIIMGLAYSFGGLNVTFLAGALVAGIMAVVILSLVR